MKIAVLVQYSSNFGGSTISGQLVARALRDSGWCVHVVFGFSGPFERVFENEGCETHVIPHRNWLRSGSLQGFLMRFYAEWKRAADFEELFQELRPTLVYVNSLVSYAASVGASRRDIPVVWHLRELFEDEGGELAIPCLFGKRWVRSQVRKYADRIVCISKAAAVNVLGVRGCKQAHIIPNAVDESFFANQVIHKDEARRKLGIVSGSYVVGIPGTLRRLKGHEFLFRTVDKILEVLPGCVFVVSGDITTDYATEVVEQAKAASVLDSVCFLGTVEDMRWFYACCDVICVPSRSESFGRTVIEAFASRRPVVASAVGGMREIIRDGENGRLVEFGDTDSLCAAIVELLTDSVSAKHFSDVGYEDASRHYREAACAGRIQRLVGELF